jgi:DNA-directed RNA polymerase sigma subunit (sigma70/sigma32)
MYIGLLNTFKDLYKARKKKLEDLENRYEQGLEKLKESEQDVLRMHRILEDLQPKLGKINKF